MKAIKLNRDSAVDKAMKNGYFYCVICEEDIYGRAEILLHMEGMKSVHDIIEMEVLK